MEPENNLNQNTTEQTMRFESLRRVTPLSKYLAMILFIIMPFIGGWIGYVYAPEKVAIPQQVIQIENDNETDAVKKSFYGGEIPSSWSQYTNFEAPPLGGIASLRTSIKFSFAENHVTVSDWNAKQVNFYLMTENAANDYIAETKAWALIDGGIEITEEQLGGAPAIVIKWPLYNGEVTKAGTGGTSYLIRLPYQDSAEYLFIEKQAKGNDHFEKAFSHYIFTADFTEQPGL